jgi:pimeloyl-ACP methyl ester carboxylesterase
MQLLSEGPKSRSRMDQPPLIVLHGGGPGCHAAADFSLLLPQLARPVTYLLDLPGYGGTPIGDPRQGRFTAYADHLEASLDQAGIEICDILTQSLGGIAALLLASRRPGRIRRLMAISSQPVPGPPGIHVDPGLGSSARASYYGAIPTPEKLVEHVMSLEWHDPARIPSALIERRFEASTTPTALAVARQPSLLGLPEDLSGCLADASAKTLVVWGEHDPFGEPAYGEWLAARLPNADLAVIRGGAHHPQSELPAETAAVAARFLGY